MAQTKKKAASAARSSSAKKSGSTKKKSTSSSGRSTTTAGKSRTSSTNSNRKKAVPVQTKPLENREPAYSFPLGKEILALLSVFGCLLLFYAAFEHKQNTFSALHNAVRFCFGDGAYFMPFLAMAGVLMAIFSVRRQTLPLRIAALCLWLLAACGLCRLFTEDGGIIGAWIYDILTPTVGTVGEYILMILLLMIGLVILTKRSFTGMIRKSTDSAVRKVQDNREIREGQRKIHDSERMLAKEQAKSRKLAQQQERLRRLEEERQAEIRRQQTLAQFHGIGDTTIEPDDDDLEYIRRRQAWNKKTEEEETKKSRSSKSASRKEQEIPDDFMDDIHLIHPMDDAEDEIIGRQDTRSARDLADLDSRARGREKDSLLDTMSDNILRQAEASVRENPDPAENSAKDEESIVRVSPVITGLYEPKAETKTAADAPVLATPEPEIPMDEEEDFTDEPVPSDELSSFAGLDFVDDEIYPEEEESTMRSDPAGEILPSNEDFNALSEDIFEQDQTSGYEQELPPDESYAMAMQEVQAKKKTYLEQQQELHPTETRTVRTASGKLITHEVDGVPGERKLPRELPPGAEGMERKEMPGNLKIEEQPPKEYDIPPLDLLKAGPSPSANSDETRQELLDTANKLQTTLQTFGVGVTITNISCGPSVTRYELQPDMGVKVSRIVSLTDDIKLNLAAEDIRMEAPIPGKAAIGIEVPNREKKAVMLRDLLESEEFQKHPSKIAFAAGRDIGGKVVLADIAKMPHLLIAGATGSGKSVCINTIIMSILYKAKPDEVKLIMVDPKVVELSVYNGIPHLLLPVVTDPKKASAALNWAVEEMDRRYQAFAQFKVRDMKGFNQKVEKEAKEHPETADQLPKKMPQIVIIIDELADLMMVAPGEVEESICRLAQLARAAGLHLIIATQRPSVQVITGLIKANVPSRIAFSVSSGTDSRIIIDMNGAEKLLGKGDMLFFPAGYPKPVRVQGTFVSDDEVTDVVKYWTDQVEEGEETAETSINLDAHLPASESSAASAPGNDQDELYEKAARLIIDKEKASIGVLQRVLKIGFNRAARIMDALAEDGVVSVEESTKPRRVLMTLEEFETMFAEKYR